MSLSILESLRDDLQSQGLLDGYELKFNHWTDLSQNQEGNFVLLRFSGPGSANRIQQRYDIDIFLFASQDKRVHTQRRAEDIKAFLLSTFQPSEVVRYSALGNATGPFQLENGRWFFKISAQAYDSVDLS